MKKCNREKAGVGVVAYACSLRHFLYLFYYGKDTKKKSIFPNLADKKKEGQSPAPSPLKQIILMSLFSLFFTAKIRKIFHISYSKYTQKTASTCNQ